MITISKLTKKFTNNGDEKVVFTDFDFSIERGEKIGLFGPNGSGKTTLLNIFAGIDKSHKGKIQISGKKVAYVHQDYNSTLLPWFTCEKNILLAREYNDLDTQKGKNLLKELVQELDINFSLKQYPFVLSGGQKQIVTLLRALVLEPDILLMDEPFAALDVGKRANIQKVLKAHYKNDLTVIVCSHRGEEVKTLLDRAVVIEGSPSRITKDVKVGGEISEEKFQTEISQIKFKKNE